MYTVWAGLHCNEQVWGFQLMFLCEWTLSGKKEKFISTVSFLMSWGVNTKQGNYYARGNSPQSTLLLSFENYIYFWNQNVQSEIDFSPTSQLWVF